MPDVLRLLRTASILATPLFSFACADDAATDPDASDTTGAAAASTGRSTNSSTSGTTAPDTDTIGSSDTTAGEESSSGSSSSDGSSSSGEEVEAGLLLLGASGDEIVLNKLWIQGCIRGSDGIDWVDVRRVLVTDTDPFELVATMTEFQNGSATPDCENGMVGEISTTLGVLQTVVQTPVTWVDEDGNDAPAPEGLEDVTHGNGLEGILSAASVTPATEERADQLNGVMFCGVDTWQAGVTEDTTLCFNGGAEPALGTAVLVVDDSQMPWRNYQSGQASTIGENGYPNQMPNVLPFEGPFEP